MCARTFECEHGKPVFDSDGDEPDNPNSPENTVQHKLTNDETCTTPGTTREGSLEIFSPLDRLCDGTDTNFHKEPDAEASSAQPNPTNVKPRRTKYDLHHNPMAIAMTITNIDTFVSPEKFPSES